MSACDGEEALEIYRREADVIDCVLLDLSMSKLGGDEVFEQLRAHRSDIRVILNTGYPEKQVMDRFHGAGLAGVLQKPAQKSALLAKVAEVLS
jgi:two-component system, cell cycle sensor histidine kinase and response regulator CckA